MASEQKRTHPSLVPILHKAAELVLKHLGVFRFKAKWLKGDVEKLAALLQHGADINLIDSQKWTALHQAAWSRNSNDTLLYLTILTWDFLIEASSLFLCPAGFVYL